MKFSTGDRVAVYSSTGGEVFLKRRTVCEVVNVLDEDIMQVKWRPSSDSIHSRPVHIKQCRKLRKKERRTVFVCEDRPFTYRLRRHCDKCIEYREVRKKK